MFCFGKNWTLYWKFRDFFVTYPVGVRFKILVAYLSANLPHKNITSTALN